MEKISDDRLDIAALERNSLQGIIIDLWRILAMEKSDGWTKANEYLLRKKLHQLFEIARAQGVQLPDFPP